MAMGNEAISSSPFGWDEWSSSHFHMDAFHHQPICFTAGLHHNSVCNLFLIKCKFVFRFPLHFSVSLWVSETAYVIWKKPSTQCQKQPNKIMTLAEWRTFHALKSIELFCMQFKLLIGLHVWSTVGESARTSTYLYVVWACLHVTNRDLTLTNYRTTKTPNEHHQKDQV